MTYDFRTLHTVHPFGAFAIRIPARWSCKPLNDGTDRWVCDEDKDEDWTGSLWLAMKNAFPPEGTGAEPRDWQQDLAKKIVATDHAAARAVEHARVEETAEELFWAHEDTTIEDGDLLRFYWHRRAVYTDRGPILLQTNLVIEDQNKADPEFLELVALVEREIRGAAIAPPVDPAQGADRAGQPSQAAKMPDWQSSNMATQVIELSKGQTVKIPVAWTMTEENGHTWWAMAPDERASLKIQSEFGKLDQPLTGTDAVAERQRELETQIVAFLDSESHIGALVRDDIQGGRLVHGVTEFSDAGEEWIAFRWYACMAFEKFEGVARYILSLEKGLETTPLGQSLIAHVGDQARNMQVRPEEIRAAPLSDWRDVALDDRLFFRLPLPMDIRVDEKPGREATLETGKTWYAWFSGDEVSASMYVSMRERMVLKYDDGDPVDFTDQPELFEKVLRPWTEAGVVETVDHGWLKYERFDDTEDHGDEVDPDNWRTQPLRNDHWNYMAHIPGGFLDVDWLLLTPYESVDPDITALIAKVGEMVKSARFAGPAPGDMQ